MTGPCKNLRTNRRRRGIALMLVVAVVALAAVLGLVMLSSATLANRSGGNQGRLLSGEYLAESGVNLALYYLQYPDRAPSLNASGYWSGTGGPIAIGSSVQGTVDVTVARDASNPWAYEIVSTGTAGAQSETQVTRTTGARVLVRNAWDIKYAVGTNSTFQVNPGITLNGDAYTTGNLSVKYLSLNPGPALVSGYGYCQTYTSALPLTWLVPLKGWKTLAHPTAGSPLSSEVFNYKTGYWWSNAKYNADVIGSATTSWGSTAPAASGSNPAHIFYRDGSGGAGTFTLNDNVVLAGTLVIDGDLTVAANATTGITITPVTSAYPALVVTGKLTITQPKSKLTVNGTCFVGTQLATSGSAPALLTDYSKFIVNGGLIIGNNSSSPVASSYTVITTVTYNSTKAAPVALKVNKGVSILRWGLP